MICCQRFVPRVVMGALFAACWWGLGVAAGQPGWPPAPEVPAGLGVNIHFTDPKPGELEQLAAGGFRWVRMDLTWDRTEEACGTYDFTAYERLLSALGKYKIRAVLILDYSNPLYEATGSVATNAGRGAYARWAAAAAKHFRGRGIVWEIWNEPNISQFWKPAPDPGQYAAMALAASRAIRTAAPGEIVVGPAASKMDFRFLEACFKAGLLEWWDAVSVHPYRESEPESADIEYAKLRGLIARYAPKGKAIPILSGEWGYSSASAQCDAQKQGKLLPRQWLTNIAEGVPLSIWYDWHDDGNNPREPEHHFGTVSFDYHRNRVPVYDAKPAYLAAQTLTKVLEGRHFVRRIAVGALDDHVLLFHKGDELALAAWTTRAREHEIKVPFSARSFEVVEHTGERRPGASGGGTSLVLSVTDAPVYVVVKGPDPLLFAAPAVHPMRIRLIPGGDILAAHVENLAELPLTAKVRLVELEGIRPLAVEQPLTFRRGEAETVVRFRLASRPPGQYRVGLRVVGNSGEPLVTLPARWYRALTADLLRGCSIIAAGDPEATARESISVAAAPTALAGFDATAVKINYRFDGGWKYLRVVTPRWMSQQIAGKPTAFGFWVHGDGRETIARLRVVDSRGQTWQPEGERIDWTGWRYIELKLGLNASHWGGSNDGVMHYPLAWDTLFLIDNPSREPTSGELFVTAPVIIY